MFYHSDEIEYPNISDIRMKDDSFGSQPDRPVVDRNSKAAALHVYGTKNMQKDEILSEHEKIMDRSIQNEREMLTAEQKLKQIHENQEQTANDQEQNELLMEKCTELKHRLMEMEDRQKEYVSMKKDTVCNSFYVEFKSMLNLQNMENSRLTKIIQEYEAQETSIKERGERISQREAAILEEEAVKRR